MAHSQRMELQSVGRQESVPLHTRAGLKNKVSTKTAVMRGIADFFGVGEESPQDKVQWQRRRQRLHTKSRASRGKVKSSHMQSTTTLDDVDSRALPHIRDPYHRPTGDSASMYSRQVSGVSARRVQRQQPLPRRTKKDSVARMAIDGISNIIAPKKKSKRKPHLHSRSFAPGSISSAWEVDGLSMLSPSTASILEDESLVDDVFFDVATPTSPYVTPKYPKPGSQYYPKIPTAQPVAAPSEEPYKEKLKLNIDASGSTPPSYDEIDSAPRTGWRRKPPPPAPDTPAPDTTDGIGMKRIMGDLVDKAFDNSDRHQVGVGFVGRLCKRQRKKNLSYEVKKQLDQMDDHRPYFTYWVTFVQVLIYIVSVATYGIAPIGFEETAITSEVLLPTLSTESKSYFEKDNFWIGPRQADLIHLGAKYSPCMRSDTNIVNAISVDRKRENETACCIRNDGSGCFQTRGNRASCSPILSTWKKWSVNNTGFQGRVSGSVCGQDPKYCAKPSSVAPFEWADDITKWPICEKKRKVTNLDDIHMTCEVTGHPCCFGIQGECMITTREHCQFIRGYFHEEAALCSQVPCMNQICGMIPFYFPQKPDQIYRFWLSLFIHAGLLQLLITIAFQFFLMRDLEKLAGWLRIAIVYLGSGIAGSLGSAIFLPYHVEAGPSGAQFGILACLFVEVIQSWQMLEKPWWAIGKLAIFTLLLFILGLLPMIDNYAHLIGFIAGILLAFVFLPYVSFGEFDKRRKKIGIAICLLTFVGVFALLLVLFYVLPIYQCSWCQYFNCIPFTSKFCKSMEIEIRRPEDY